MNKFPKLHNATWPGIVGKGPDAEPPIAFDTMLQLTATAEVEGQKFDGVDLGLMPPHLEVGMDEGGIRQLADKVAGHGLVIGSLVAPIWGGPAMGTDQDRKNFIENVRKTCHIGQRLRQLGIRPYGVVRIDSASSPQAWAADAAGNSRKIAETFRQACDVAADYGEKLAAEGEICWGGMHSWRTMLDTLEAVDRPNMGFQADMSHTLLYTMGYNRPEDRILPENFSWDDPATLDAALRQLTNALRPWTIDFHVAQNDGTVFGSGSHDKTGRHCPPDDPNGKLDIAHHAGFWLRDENGTLTKTLRHICWDGCMFPNATMMNQQTWNNVLATMLEVRQANGWTE